MASRVDSRHHTVSPCSNRIQLLCLQSLTSKPSVLLKPKGVVGWKEESNCLLPWAKSVVPERDDQRWLHFYFFNWSLAGLQCCDNFCYCAAKFYICIYIYIYTHTYTGFPGGSDGKASAWNARDPGSTPGLGRSLGEGNGNPLRYSYLENSMDWGAQ